MTLTDWAEAILQVVRSADDVERDRLYGVWDGPEDEYSGYVYLDESLAKQHAEAVYGGRVVRMTLYRKLAPWVAEMSAGSAEGDTK